MVKSEASGKQIAGPDLTAFPDEYKRTKATNKL